MNNINNTAQDQALRNNLNPSEYDKLLDFCLQGLQLDNCEVSDLEITSKEVDGTVHQSVIVHIRSTERLSQCPHEGCGAHLHSHGPSKVGFRHLSLGDNPINICFYKNRYKCSKCGRTISTEAPFQYGNTRMTTALANNILNGYVDKLSYTGKAVARYLCVSEYYANLVIERYCDEMFRGGLKGIENADQCMLLPPEYLITDVLVDEVSIKGRKYVTCVYDANNLRLLFYVLKNNKDAIKSFIEWGGDKISPELRVACDMNAPFVSAFKEALPSCQITLDRFHVMVNIVDDFERAFLDIAFHMPDSNEVKSLLLDKNKEAIKVLVSRKSELDKDQKKLLKKLLENNYDMKTLYESYQSIIKCYDKSKSITEFRASIFKIMEDLLWVDAKSEAFSEYSKTTDVYQDCHCKHYLTPFPGSDSDKGALNQQTDNSNFNADVTNSSNTNGHDHAIDDKEQSPVNSKEEVVPYQQADNSNFNADVTNSSNTNGHVHAIDDKEQSPVNSKEKVVPSSQSSENITDSKKPNKKKRKRRESSIVRLCRRLSSKLEYIANFTSTKLTTGPIEGLNNRLKSVKRARYGIKYLYRFMDIILIQSLKGYSGSVKTAHA